MQSINWHVVTLPNGKSYGEMRWENKRNTLHVDEAALDGKAVLKKMLPGVKLMIRTRVNSYLAWRKNSFTMSHRVMLPRTQAAIDKLYMMLGNVNASQSIKDVAKVVYEHEDYLMMTKPACDNHLWTDMEFLMEWAKAVHGYRTTHFSISKERTPAVRS